MRPFLISCAVCALAILAGSLTVAVFGYEPPGRLLALEAALFSLLALAAGFGLCSPRLPGWVWQRPVRGAACVVVGVGAMYVPPQLLVSALFIGLGTRLVWLSACELEPAGAGPPAIVEGTRQDVPAIAVRAVRVPERRA